MRDRERIDRPVDCSGVPSARPAAERAEAAGRPSVVCFTRSGSKAVWSAAMIFKQLDWNVGVLADPAHADAARNALGAFPSDGIARVETLADRLFAAPDVLVRSACGGDHLGSLLGPSTTEIVLVGSRVDDGSKAWTSCDELIAYMRSGMGMMTRIRDERGIHGSPYLAAGHLASFFVGLHAVMLAGAVMLSPARPRSITVSAQECLLATLHNAVGFAQIDGRDAGRADDPPKAGGRFECCDGFVFLSMPEAHHWGRLIALIEDPALAEGDWWKQARTRDDNRERLAEAIGRWCRGRTREAVFETLQEAGVPAAFLSSAEDIFANPHLRARGFFTGAPDGVYPFDRPFRVTRASSALGSPGESPGDLAVRSGAQVVAAIDRGPVDRLTNSETRSAARRRSAGEGPYLPLAGLRVCDLSWAWAGPLLTERLAMLGASVVKVESRSRLDTHRSVVPYAKTPGEQHDRAFGHLVSSRGKLSVTVDLKHAGGLGLVKDLIARSDLLVSNFAPGALERLGLGADVVTDLVGKRGFVGVALSGFGATGPWRSYRAYGAQLADLTGLNGLTGTPETPPISMGIPFGDPMGGTFGAAAALHYLRESRALGTPVWIEISQFELLLSAISDALVEGRATGNRRRGDLPGTGVYPCKAPDTWIAVSVRDAAAAGLLAKTVGASDTSASDLEARISAWTAERSAGEAVAQLRALERAGRDPADARGAQATPGLECTEVLSAAELLSDPGLRAGRFWEFSPHGLWMPGVPWTADGERPVPLGPAPRLGEHTHLVAREMLGYSDEWLRELDESGALR